jgi:hypothetical protein
MIKPGMMIAVAAAVISGYQESPESKRFSSEEGRFQVSLPGDPKKNEETIKTTTGTIKIVSFEVTHSSGDYLVIYSDFPPKMMTAGNIDRGLASSQRNIVAAAQGTLLSSEKIEQDGFPGLDFTYRLKSAGISGKAVGRAHLVVVHNRLYQVSIVTAIASAKSAKTDAFFDSFKFDAAPPEERPAAASTSKKGKSQVPAKRRAAPSAESESANMPDGANPRRSGSQRKSAKSALDPSTWQEWTLDNKPTAISIRVPSRPRRRQERGILGVAQREVYTWSVGSAEYTVRTQPIPKAALAKGPATVLTALRDALAKENRGRIAEDRKTTIDENPAREFQIRGGSLGTDLMRVRLVVVGSQLYEQIMTGTRAETTGDAADRFFDSFKLAEHAP